MARVATTRKAAWSRGTSTSYAAVHSPASRLEEPLSRRACCKRLPRATVTSTYSSDTPKDSTRLNWTALSAWSRVKDWSNNTNVKEPVNASNVFRAVSRVVVLVIVVIAVMVVVTVVAVFVIDVAVLVGALVTVAVELESVCVVAVAVVAVRVPVMVFEAAMVVLVTDCVAVAAEVE